MQHVESMDKAIGRATIGQSLVCTAAVPIYAEHFRRGGCWIHGWRGNGSLGITHFFTVPFRSTPMEPFFFSQWALSDLCRHRRHGCGWCRRSSTARVWGLLRLSFGSSHMAVAFVIAALRFPHPSRHDPSLWSCILLRIPARRGGRRFVAFVVHVHWFSSAVWFRFQTHGGVVSIRMLRLASIRWFLVHR